MDPFAVVVLVVVALAVFGAVLSARASAGRPLREFGAGHRRAVKPHDATARLENQDLEEMVAALNARSRARGLPERTVADAIREFERE